MTSWMVLESGRCLVNINMKKFLYKLQAKFLTWFGNIKVFKWPLFVIYDPTSFKVTGEQILQVLDMLQPGDVILRGYQHYLDGMFIPGDYSHGAIYVGDRKIIHAVAAGVSYIDVVEFCMCDRICILRPNKYQASAIKTAKKLAANNIPYDFGFKRGTSALYCFELCAECYKKLDIKPETVKAFFGLLKKKNVYVAKSFTKSPDFKIVFQSDEDAKAGD